MFCLLNSDVKLFSKLNSNSDILVVQFVGIIAVGCSNILVIDLNRLNLVAFVGLYGDSQVISSGSMAGLAFLDLVDTCTICALLFTGHLNGSQNSNFTVLCIVHGNIDNLLQLCGNDQAALRILSDGTGISAIAIQSHCDFLAAAVTAFHSISNAGQTITGVRSYDNDNFALSGSTLTQRRYGSGSGRQLITALLLVLIDEVLADTTVSIAVQDNLTIGRLICQVVSMQATVVTQVSLLVAIIAIAMTVVLSGAGNGISTHGSIIQACPVALCSGLTDVCTPQEFFVVVDAILTDTLSIIGVVVDSSLSIDGITLLIIIHVGSESRSVGIVGCQIDSHSGICVHGDKLTAYDGCLHLLLGHLTALELGHICIAGITLIIQNNLSLSVHIVIQRSVCIM